MKDNLPYRLRLQADIAIKAVLAVKATENDDPGVEAMPLVIKEFTDEQLFEAHCRMVAEAASALEAAELYHREIVRRQPAKK